MIRFGSVLQKNWDWRAAGNFMFGGTGSALMAMTAIASYPHSPPWAVSLTALAFVGLGLGLVWLEIGRPWRFLHVYFHPQTSWMTREGSVAVLLFLSALAGIVLQSTMLIAAAGVFGLLFLYCQSRILQASKGIPVWREPAISPLLISTGLAEGTGVLTLVVLAGPGDKRWLVEVFLLLLVIRTWAWFNYCGALQKSQAPVAALDKLKGVQNSFLIAGNLLPLLLAIAYLVGDSNSLLVPALLLAVVTGWQMKFTVIAKAAMVQGYRLGKLQRGRPIPKSPVRRSGDPWRA